MSKTHHQSKYETGISKLGITAPETQEALLRVFYLAGYLKPENIWADINRIGGIANPEKLFASIYCTLVNAHAIEGDTAPLDTKYLRTHFLDTTLITDTDSADLILYMAQHAFNRKTGQERSELKSSAWMTEPLKAQEFIEAAKTLGLIDAIPPKLQEYDFVWIFGASRLGMLARVIEYQYLLNKGLEVKGPTQALAGDRELWAEIDGIDPIKLAILMQAAQEHSSISILPIAWTPDGETAEEKTRKIEEGKSYLKSLAQKHSIPLNPDEPFIIKGGRTYANSLDGRKLTETMMAQDLLEQFLSGHQITTIDTTTQAGSDRPNTSTTAFDAAKAIIAHPFVDTTDHTATAPTILHGLTISNQPYVTRQKLSAQQATDKATQGSTTRIVLDGSGVEAKTSVSVIHSELGAMISEMYNAAHVESTRELQTLLFQSRNNDSGVPQMPDLSAIDCTGVAFEVE